MAYNGNLPADDGYLSEFPAQQRENQRALKEDKITNAGKLQGLIPGNESGQIPTNNGALNINLNAEKLMDMRQTIFLMMATNMKRRRPRATVSCQQQIKRS